MSLPPFETLVARHGATVYRVCRAVVGPDLAEDAWSETFLSALRAYPALDMDANVEAWLVTIAHRRALDQMRAEQRRPRPTADLPEPAGSPLHAEETAGLRSAIAALPLKQRQTVAYHYLAGLPYAEVAATVGGTPEAARRAAADGIAALRRALSPPPTPPTPPFTRPSASPAPTPTTSTPTTGTPTTSTPPTGAST